MKIIRQNILPPKGFLAINLFGYLFCRPNAKITDITINHEQIHTEQMKEMLYVPFICGMEQNGQLNCSVKEMRIEIFPLREKLTVTSTIQII